MKLVCISDTHGDHERVQLPDGDLLIHAGDCTAHGSRDDYHSFVVWFSQQPHEHKIFIGGNHDTYLESHPEEVLTLAKERGLHYLCDSGVNINGINFWGSPITPRFHDWSFMRDTQDIHQHWSMIPKDTQVLITHGPVWGVLDEVRRSETLTENTGCPLLAETVTELGIDYHIFGHIHEGYGSVTKQGTRYLNVSTMNEHYKISNTPVLLEV